MYMDEILATLSLVAGNFDVPKYAENHLLFEYCIYKIYTYQTQTINSEEIPFITTTEAENGFITLFEFDRKGYITSSFYQKPFEEDGLRSGYGRWQNGKQHLPSALHCRPA